MKTSFLYIGLILSFSIWTTLASAKEYFIKANQHHAEALNLSNKKLYSGPGIEFQAMFNSTNIYELPGADQGDINKLYGISDCLNHHMQSSVRFGWRWYNHQMEIFGLIHRGGQLYFSELLGVASLNTPHHFKIELSADKGSYLLSFNKQSPIALKRDCTTNAIKGYYLFPYFGGNRPAPHDMKVTVWENLLSDLFITQVAPNPVRPNQNLKIKLKIQSSQAITFQLINSVGAVIYSTPTQRFQGSENVNEYILKIPGHLPAGIYFIRPVGKLVSEAVKVLVI